MSKNSAFSSQNLTEIETVQMVLLSHSFLIKEDANSHRLLEQQIIENKSLCCNPGITQLGIIIIYFVIEENIYSTFNRF